MKKVKNKTKQIKQDAINADRWNLYNFDQTVAKFVLDEPFYSHICSNTNKYKTKDLKTAGVTLEDDRFVLYYNEDFFNSLSWIHRQGLLIHEFLHIIFGHVTSRAKYEKNGRPDRAWLYACDFAINSLIEERRLPPGGLMPGRWRELSISERKKHNQEYIDAYDRFKVVVRNWPKGKSSEWYFKEINKNRKDFEIITRDEEFDFGHSGWSRISPEEAELLKDKTKKLIEEAVSICQSSNRWGSVSNKLQKELKLIMEGSISWKDILRNFVQTSTTIHRTSSIKKINRRYPYIHPGRKREKTTKIVVCIDQSGSIDDKSLKKFFTELDNLSEFIEFVVVPFDSEVIESGIFTWKKGEKVEHKRVARGGTDFSPPTKWINDNFSEFDAALFMTDGKCSRPISCNITRAWIISKNGGLTFDTNEIIIDID